MLNLMQNLLSFTIDGMSMFWSKFYAMLFWEVVVDRGDLCVIATRINRFQIKNLILSAQSDIYGHLSLLIHL